MTERLENFGVDHAFDTGLIWLEEDIRERQLEALSLECILQGVEFLKEAETFPNEEINRLMGFFWDLIDQEVIEVGFTDEYSLLNFWPGENNDQEMGSLAISTLFSYYCEKAPTIHLKKILVTASHAQDFYNGRYEPLEGRIRRADAYLAEFLRTRKILPPTFIASGDEKTLLVAYPEGINSLPIPLRPVQSFIVQALIGSQSSEWDTGAKPLFLPGRDSVEPFN